MVKETNKTGVYRKNVISLPPSDSLRTETLESKEYLIVPVVLLREGVHNEEFISYGEIVPIYADAWSGRTLVIDHPLDEDGVPVTANSPSVYEKSRVGMLFNVKARDDIRGISGELWIDVEKAATVPGGDETVKRLQGGGNLEVSTGYFTFVDNVEGDWRDPVTGKVEHYMTSQYGVRPDHLALLPFDEGACNWADGCGAPRVNKKDATQVNADTQVNTGTDHTVNSEKVIMAKPDLSKFNANILSTARKPSYDGKETTSWASVNKSFGAYAKAYMKSSGTTGDAPSSIKDAPAAMKKWIASKSLLGDAAADDNRDLIFFPVVNPSTNKLNAGALRAVLGGRGAQANISADAAKSAQDKARELLKSEFNADIKQNAQLTINGDRIGNALKAAIETRGHESGSDETLSDLAQAADIDDTTMQMVVAGELDFIPRQWLNIWAAMLDIDPYELYYAASSDNSMATYYYDGDETAENAIENNSAKNVAAVTIPHTNVEKPCGCKNKELASNEEEKRKMEKKQRVDALIANDKTQFAEAHRDWLMSLDDTQIALLEPKVEAAPVVNTAAVVVAPVAAPVIAQVVEPKPLTKDQLLATLGVDADALIAAQALVSNQKAARVQKIKDILAVEGCEFTEAELSTFSDKLLDKTFDAVQPAAYRVAATSRANSNDVIPKTPSIMTAAPGVRGVDFAAPVAAAKGGN